ncbi:MAG: RluA family pseudouridine synthase [Bacillota bacterium]
MKEIRISGNEAEQRLDRFLRKYLKEFSLGEIYKLFRKNKVKVNGKRVKENQMLQEGDVVQLYIAQETSTAQQPTAKKQKTVAAKPIDIVYEDERLLIINKPVGLLTHPDKPGDSDTAVDRALSYLEGKGELEQSVTFRPSVCNRLDRNTGGLIIIAKTYQALKAVNEMIRERRIRKLYICVVKGRLKGSGDLKGFLKKDKADNVVSITGIKDSDTKEIHTHYKVLGSNAQNSLLEVELITGRSHQIRAHFADIGHPLIGDVKYGDKEVNRYFKTRYKLTHQFLFAYKLEFITCSKELEYLNGRVISCRLPVYMENIVESLFGME